MDNIFLAWSHQHEGTKISFVTQINDLLMTYSISEEFLYYNGRKFYSKIFNGLRTPPPSILLVTYSISLTLLVTVRTLGKRVNAEFTKSKPS